MTNKTDKNWELLFDKYKILLKLQKEGRFIISSEQINKFRQSRLMTKFDHKSSLPDLFKKNNLSILPISRGSYVISDFEAYQPINYNKSIKSREIRIPKNIESLEQVNLYSESSALNCAYVCGIIDDILEDQSVPTVSGRMGTSAFNFFIDRKNNSPIKISNSNSQCEIDGGYESDSKLALIEAKNFTSDDFLIRQIYYPYRLWANKIRKEVVPIFMTYCNNIFSFFIFKFIDTDNYNSLELVEQKNYTFGSELISLHDITEILEQTKIIKEPQIPFPQADKFERIFDLLGVLMEKDLTMEEITANYCFEKRQTNYYTSGGMYLGVMEKKKNDNKIVYSLNELGRNIMSLPHKQKVLALAKQILEHEVFNKTMKLYIKKACPVSNELVFSIMKSCNIYNINTHNTYMRRAKTVGKWVDWIFSLQNDNE